MTHDALTTALKALASVADHVTHDQLGNPTPCEAWTVAQVLLHAAGDQHAWAATVGSAALPTYDPFDPPQDVDGEVAGVVRAAVEVASATWGAIDATVQELPTPLPPAPTMPPDLAAAAAALDAAVHAWDVAVATGQPSPLTSTLADLLRPAADATADQLRGFAYAAALPPEPDDDSSAALLRFLGRDPSWS